MKGKIDANGCLCLERAGQLKLQDCPYRSLVEGKYRFACGDWCPHFGEPEYDRGFPTIINLSCGNGRTWYFDELIDRRRVHDVTPEEEE